MAVNAPGMYKLARQVSAHPWATLHGFCKLRPILASCFPKAGTHLLVRLLSVIPEVRYVGHAQADLAGLGGRLERLRSGGALTSHLAWSPELVRDVLDRRGFARFFMIRDLRDVAVSNYHYITKTPNHRLHQYFVSLPDDHSRLMASICGISSAELEGQAASLSIGQHAENYVGWVGDEGCLTLKFEDLVGAKGGGSEPSQREAVRRVMQHLGLKKSQAALDKIRQQVFNPSSRTFRRGQIGAWRDEFTEAHVARFKEVAGDVLIRLGYEQDTHWGLK